MHRNATHSQLVQICPGVKIQFINFARSIENHGASVCPTECFHELLHRVSLYIFPLPQRYSLQLFTRLQWIVSDSLDSLSVYCASTKVSRFLDDHSQASICRCTSFTWHSPFDLISLQSVSTSPKIWLLGKYTLQTLDLGMLLFGSKS